MGDSHKPEGIRVLPSFCATIIYTSLKKAPWQRARCSSAAGTVTVVNQTLCSKSQSCHSFLSPEFLYPAGLRQCLEAPTARCVLFSALAPIHRCC